MYDGLKETSHYIPELEDFVVDIENSTIDDLVLHNSKTGETNISFRGTQKLSDWKTNLKTMSDLGFDEGKAFREDPLIKSAISTAEKVVDKYGAEKVTLSSHSLGGSKSFEVSQYFGEKGIHLKGFHFDPGVSIRQMRKQKFLPKSSKRKAEEEAAAAAVEARPSKRRLRPAVETLLPAQR